jgi:hypothetical protein
MTAYISIINAFGVDIQDITDVKIERRTLAPWELPGKITKNSS